MSAKRRPSLPPMPDLDHLTEEEREIIESVIQRQREEEEKEQEILRNLQDEFESYQESVKKLGEEVQEVVTTGETQEAVCEICRKTKFADGVGHQCHYCHVKSCSRCGGKMMLRGKEIWACSLCRKKHDILVKTGQWYHGGMAKPVGLDVDRGSDSSSAKMESSPLSEKNLQFSEDRLRSSPPIARQESLQSNFSPSVSVSMHAKELRRQYSLTDTKRQRQDGGRSSADLKPSGRDGLIGHAEKNATAEFGDRDLPRGEKSSSGNRRQHHSKDLVGMDASGGLRISDRNQRKHMDSRRADESPIEGQYSTREQGGDDRTQDWLSAREQTDKEDSRRRGTSRNRVECEYIERRKDHSFTEPTDAEHQSSHPMNSNDVHRHHHRDSSNDRHRDRMQRVSPEKGQEMEQQSRRVRVDDTRRVDLHRSNGQHHAANALSSPQLERHPERLMKGHGQSVVKDSDKFGKHPKKSGGVNHRGDRHASPDGGDFYADQLNQRHLDPNSISAAVRSASHTHRRGENMSRNDSLGSDLSDCVRPPTLKPKKSTKGSKHSSMSSSDEEMATTPEGTSWEDQEFINDKGQKFKSGYNFVQRADSPEKWKKDEMLAAKITKFLTHPATWQLAADGTKLIGHMVLCKSVDGLPPGEQGGILGKGTLGLKVTGGKMTEYGYLGAFITKVKRGSIADTVAHLEAGDEVVEWNSHCLRSLTFEDVYDIIFESKSDPQVELTVERNLSRLEMNSSRMSEQLDEVEGQYDSNHLPAVNRKKPSVTITSPSSPNSTMQPRSHYSSTTCGRIQVKFYYDAPSYQLIVTVAGASDLSSRDNGQPRNPYCKLYMLPNRSEKSKRRTKTVAGTLEPKWNQSFIYAPIKRRDLKSHSLQITIYDYDRIGSGEYVGETIIDLCSADIYDRLQWFNLYHHDDTESSVTSTSHEDFGKDHLSPPSSLSRLSDSDISEFDHDGYSHTRGTHYSSSDTLLVPEGCSQRGIPGVTEFGGTGNQLRSGIGQIRSEPFSPTERCDPIGSSSCNILSPGSSPVSDTSSFKKRQLPRIPLNKSTGGRDQVTQELETRARVLKQQLPVRRVDGGQPMSDAELSQSSRQKERFSEWDYPDDASLPPGSVSESSRHKSRDFRPESQHHHSKTRTLGGRDERTPLPTDGQSPIAMSPAAPKHRSRSHNPDRGKDPGYPAAGGNSISGVESVPSHRSRDRSRSREQSYSSSISMATTETKSSPKSRMNGRNRDDWTEYPSSAATSKRPGSYSEPTSPQLVLLPDEKLSLAEKQHPSRKHDTRRADPERHGHPRRRAEFSPEMSDEALQSDTSEISDMSEMSKISIRSTQSERPHRKLSEFASRMESRVSGGKDLDQKKTMPDASSADVGGAEDKNDGSISDSAVSSSMTDRRKRQPTIGNKVAALVGLSHKSTSTSQIGDGGKKGGRASFQRSEEVGVAADMKNRMKKQGSRESTDSSLASISSDSSTLWLPTSMRVGPDGQFGDFIEGLGPSQLVGRQVLGSACLGEIQLGIADRKAHMEVEVIRARGLVPKPGAKILPAPYIKVYLMDGKNCVEKQKTSIARRTLDPLYQQQLCFLEPYNGKILQVTVWGDYGRLERKVFMGVAQIILDDLNLSNLVIGWYKLFANSSLVNAHAPSTGTFCRQGSLSSQESAYQSGSARS